MTITVYKTPTCATCNMASKRLESAGVNVLPVDLTENPDALSMLKERLNRDVIQVPLFLDEDGGLSDITALPDLLARAAV